MVWYIRVWKVWFGLVYKGLVGLNINPCHILAPLLYLPEPVESIPNYKHLSDDLFWPLQSTALSLYTAAPEDYCLVKMYFRRVKMRGP